MHITLCLIDIIMQIHVYSRACRPLKDLIILWYVCNLCGKYRIISVHVVCDKSES